MVPATLGASNNTTVEAQDMMQMPYDKVFVGNALYEPNAGKTNVFGSRRVFPFSSDTFPCGNAITCGVPGLT